MTMVRQVLFVGTDPTTRAALARAIGAPPATSATARDAIERLASGRFELCVVDGGLPAGEAAAVIMKARACRPAVAAVALIADGAVTTAVEALRAGAADVLARPFHPSALEEALRRLMPAAPDRAMRGRPTAGVAAIGDDPAMRALLAQVALIADTDASVLIRGETGTGKEVIARLLHGASARRTGPFVAVNVAAVPESLAEAELFGHVRGAFTGADRPRVGRLCAAHGGTLFLDEIGEMPRSVQARLLRALQEREVTPLGGTPQPLDVRVVAATHGDLEAMVEDGELREDLYYRLDVVPIEIPPLRARRADIAALVEHFRREVNAREGRSVPGFALDVMQRLGNYHWPGNVRELENLVERLVVVAGTRMVVMSDLPAHMRTEVVDLEEAARDLPAMGVDLRVLLSGIEDRLIAEALARTGGNRNRAADLLRLNRSTLVGKLRRRNVA
jgi:DNA-binding NtrC family response regulator